MEINVSNYPLNNADRLKTTRMQFTAINSAQRLPTMGIEDGFELQVKADPLNPAASLVYVGSSPSEAVNPDLSWPLTRNEARGLKIKQADELYASVTALPAWVYISVEQSRKGG
ncbi:MAG: hypothetical protein PHC43_00220 [Candidatus Marinimicrobia bacterium]|jgi:hypothetical protein|nr:hypothetical protein [Candidatus Neomarinimicrobiota bacterium]